MLLLSPHLRIFFIYEFLLNLKSFNKVYESLWGPISVLFFVSYVQGKRFLKCKSLKNLHLRFKLILIKIRRFNTFLSLKSHKVSPYINCKFTLVFEFLLKYELNCKKTTQGITNAILWNFWLFCGIICKIVLGRGQNKNDKTCKSVKVIRPGHVEHTVL